MTSSDYSARYGQVVTYTATVNFVTTLLDPPTGTITFLDGSGAGAPVIGVAPVVRTGLLTAAASITNSTLAVGSHTIYARYDDGALLISLSLGINETISKANTSINLSSSPNPANLGQDTTLTASVTAAAPSIAKPNGTVTFKDGSTVIGNGTLNSAGVATLTVANLSGGSHSLTAEYAGNSNFNAASPSAPITQSVNKGNSTLSLAASPNPATAGQNVNFTVTVNSAVPASISRAGTVTLKEGSTVLSTSAVDASGVVTIGIPSLGVGSHNITAEYSGNSSFNASTSSAVSVTINPAGATTTTTTATATIPTTLNYGDTLSFPVHIGAASGTATGTVSLTDNGVTVATATLDGSGNATLTTSSLGAGSHTLVATYNGNSSFAPSSTAPTTLTVNQGTTTLAVTGPATAPVSGQNATFNVTVTDSAVGGNPPTGTVTFKDGATTIGTATLGSNGTASFTTSGLSTGSHSITAVYSGDTNFTGNTSPATNVTIGKGSSSGSLTPSTTTPSFGQPVAFSIQVAPTSPATGTPTGSVDFFDGTTLLQTVPLNNGSAEYSASNLTVGTHSIKAVYSGDTNFNGFTSSTVDVIVAKADTAVAFTSSTTAGTVGDSITFTATVSNVGAPTVVPGGSVVFKDGTTTLATVALDSNGVATYTTTSLGAGPHSITAEFTGNANLNGSTSSAINVTLNPASAVATTTTGSTLPASLNYGDPLSYTVHVAPGSGGGTPTGTVTLTDTGSGQIVAMATLDGSGNATLTTSSLGAGSHTLVATYSGDGTYASSSTAPATLTINKASTTTGTVTGPATAPTYGQDATFSVTITDSATGGTAPGGTVTFKDGATTLGTATLGSNGTATFTASGLGAGTHSITAEYSGDSNFNGSNSSATPLSFTVNKAATSVAFASSATAATAGQSLTFTATVTSAGVPSAIPSGTVTFKDGSATLATVPLDSNGVASYSTSSLGTGAHSITAVYSGDANLSGSTSTPVSINISPAGAISTTTTATGTIPTTLNYGEPLTYTVHINPTGSGGTVTLTDNGVVVATATVDGSGNATLTTDDLGAGTHNLVATYSGDGTHAPSSTDPVTLTVNKANTSTGTVSGPATTPAYGQPATFTVSVGETAAGGTPPTGTVTFRDGSTVIGTGTVAPDGTATLTTGTLPAGSHTITAEYSGDSNFNGSNSSSTPLNFTVNKANTGIEVDASASSVAAGQPLTITATISNTAAPSAIPTGTVTFKEGSTLLATVPLDANGVASYSTSSLSVGQHTITATYDGNNNLNTSTSTTTVQIIGGSGVPCTTVNTSTDGTGCGTIRGAIDAAVAALPNGDVTIQVSVPTLDLDTQLPEIVNTTGNTLTILGSCTTNPTTGRATPGTSIVMKTSFTGAALRLTNRIKVSGFSISGFNGSGVEINGTTNALTCLSIGTTAANTGDGVKITGGSNTLGDATGASLGNLISGNTGAGIRIVSGTNNSAYNQWVGLNSDGTAANKNGANALVIASGGQLKLFAGNRFRN